MRDPNTQRKNILRRLELALGMALEARKQIMAATFEVGAYTKANREVTLQTLSEKTGVTLSQIAKMECVHPSCCPIPLKSAAKLMRFASSLRNPKRLTRRQAVAAASKRTLAWKHLHSS